MQRSRWASASAFACSSSGGSRRGAWGISPPLEPEASHGGLSESAIVEQLQAAFAPCEAKNSVSFLSKWAMWGLATECEGWGYALPTAEQMIAALFARDPVEWNRMYVAAAQREPTSPASTLVSDTSTS